MKSNTGRVALVTGGSRGIGAEIAKKLAKDGCKVAINYCTSKERAAAVCKEIQSEGGIAEIFSADVTQSAQVSSLFESIRKVLGGVDILVNNAGVNQDNLLMMMSESQWDMVNNTNLKACFLTSRAAVKHMISKRFGRILNISSTSGLVGTGGQANYCASKAGLIGMTKSLAKELAMYGITVNAIAPGYIETEMTEDLSNGKNIDDLLSRIPLARAGTSEEVAFISAFLVSGLNTYMTGQVVVIDGGLSI